MLGEQATQQCTEPGAQSRTRWRRLALNSALALLWLGLALLPMHGVDSVAAQVVNVEERSICGELVASANCFAQLNQTVSGTIGEPIAVHEYQYVVPAAGPLEIIVDGIRAIDRIEAGELQLRRQIVDPIEVRVFKGDKITRVGSDTTSQEKPRVVIRAPVTPGYYFVQLRRRSAGAYYVRVNQTASGGQSAPGAACPYGVVRGFALIYDRDASVRAQLGCPKEPERSVLLADQIFQRGLMLWREDRREIIVVRATGTSGRGNVVAASAVDYYQEGDPEDRLNICSPPLEEPRRGFGRIWRADRNLRESVGCGVYPERGLQGAVQEFDRGRMIWTAEDPETRRPRLIFVIYDNGETAIFTDVFVEPALAGIGSQSPDAAGGSQKPEMDRDPTRGGVEVPGQPACYMPAANVTEREPYNLFRPSCFPGHMQ